MDYGLLWDSRYAMNVIVAYAPNQPAYMETLAHSTLGFRGCCCPERNTCGRAGTTALWCKTDSFRLSVCHDVGGCI